MSSQFANAQNVAADSVTSNGAPPSHSHSSCTTNVSVLSDGSNANPGVCYLGPLDPDYQITFTFSPSVAQFMTGIDIWSNAGGNMTDNELRRLDVEVDYFDTVSGTAQTLILNDVNIGDTTTFDDPKFVDFTGGSGSGLYQVSEVRIDDMVGTSATGRVTFREVQGVFVTPVLAPEIAITSSESGAVADGTTDNHGTEAAGAPKTVTYTIRNTGTDTLTLGGTPSVSNETNLTGPVTVGIPGATSLAPGESTTFTVTYTPAAAGAFGFDIDVASNDADEAMYDIAVSGTANEAPTVNLTTGVNPPGGPYAVTATFSEPVSGMTLSDFNVTNGTATGFANPSPGVYTVTVTPSDPLQPVAVVVPAAAAADTDGEPNAVSNTLNFITVAAPTPDELDVIEDIIIEETVRDLRNSIGFNQRAVRNARGRHAQFLRCRDLAEETLGVLSEEDALACPEIRGISIEPVFDGKLNATEKSVSGEAAFFTQKSNHNGTQRRLAFGELAFNRYDDGDTSVSLNGRVAWERIVGDDVLRGLFVGAEATRSDIDDDFDGTRNGFGLNAGAYFVDRIGENLTWDGFVLVGVGRNDLDLGNGAIDVEGDYDTRTLQAGIAVTGERQFERFDLYPELSLAYGVTSVGDADLTSTSGTGSSSENLSVNTVSLGVARFRPEFVFGGEPETGDTRESALSVAPSLLCEVVRTEGSDTDCGGGLELEWSSRSVDGLNEFSARASREVVGGDARDQVSISYEMRF